MRNYAQPIWGEIATLNATDVSASVAETRQSGQHKIALYIFFPLPSFLIFFFLILLLLNNVAENKNQRGEGVLFFLTR